MGVEHQCSAASDQGRGYVIHVAPRKVQLANRRKIAACFTVWKHELVAIACSKPLVKVVLDRVFTTVEVDFRLLLALDAVKLRFQLAINQLENPMRIKAVKKDIARVQTVIVCKKNELTA